VTEEHVIQTVEEEQAVQPVEQVTEPDPPDDDDGEVQTPSVSVSPEAQVHMVPAHVSQLGSQSLLAIKGLDWRIRGL